MKDNPDSSEKHYKLIQEINKLDESADRLIDEDFGITRDVLNVIDYLIEANFDSDTLKNKLTSLMKSHSQIRNEIWKIRDQIDFLNKCEKEGYKK